MKTFKSILLAGLAINIVLAAPFQEKSKPDDMFIKSDRREYRQPDDITRIVRTMGSSLGDACKDLLRRYGDVTIREALTKISFDLRNILDESSFYEVTKRDKRHPNVDDYQISEQLPHVFGMSENSEDDRMDSIIENVKKVVKYNQDLEQSGYDLKVGDAPLMNFDFVNKMEDIPLY